MNYMIIIINKLLSRFDEIFDDYDVDNTILDRLLNCFYIINIVSSP